MAIPGCETIMLPFLKLFEDREEHSFCEVENILAKEFQLTEEEQKKRYHYEQRRIFSTQVREARMHLKETGLVESTRRGYLKITNRGLDVLRQSPPEINLSFLDHYMTGKRLSASSLRFKPPIYKLLFFCSKCGNGDFIIPPNPKPDDIIVCNNCNSSASYKNIQAQMDKKVRREDDQLFKKLFGNFFESHTTKTMKNKNAK